MTWLRALVSNRGFLMSGDRKSYTGHGPCPYLKPKPKCSKISGVINHIEGFNAWEHGYIEMEWLNEITLNHWLSENYPYQCENDHTNQLMQYRSDINTIATSIINAVKIIHRTGYVHGDIHLGNIMINPKTMPTLYRF